MSNKEKNNLFEKLIAIHPDITVGELHQKIKGTEDLEKFIQESKLR